MSQDKTVELIDKVASVLSKALRQVQEIVAAYKTSPSKSKPPSHSHSQSQSQQPPTNPKPQPSSSSPNLYADAPKRPISAFLAFSADIRQKLKVTYPDMSMGQISKVCGKMWEKTEQAERAKYEKKVEGLKAKYEKELEAYKKVNPGYDEHKRKKKGDKKNKKNKVKEVPDGSLSED